jgi:hypothetical protein
MGTNVIVVTVDGNQYKIEKNGISDFALIGVLECILTDLKAVRRRSEGAPAPKEGTAGRKVNLPKENPLVEPVVESSKTEMGVDQETSDLSKTDNPVVSHETSTPDLRSRITKAREAIRGLNGEVQELDLSKMSDEELQLEFE